MEVVQSDLKQRRLNYGPIRKLIIYCKASPRRDWLMGAAVFAFESFLLLTGKLRIRKKILLIEPHDPNDENNGKESLVNAMRENRSQLIDAINNNCSVIFRGFGDFRLSDYDQIIETLGFRETEFPGTVPRLKISRHFYLNDVKDFTNESGDQETKKKIHPAYLSFHNENAYFPTNSKHQSTHIVMCCKTQPEYGGWTFLSDGIALNTIVKRWFPPFYKYRLFQRDFDGVPEKPGPSGEKMGYFEFTEGKHSTNGYQFGKSAEDLIAIGRKYDFEIKYPKQSLIQLWSRTLPVSNTDKESEHEYFYCNGVELFFRGLVSRDNNSFKKLSRLRFTLLCIAYWACCQPIKWKKGDIMIFNNCLVAHSGSYFRGKRNIVPAFGRFEK